MAETQHAVGIHGLLAELFTLNPINGRTDYPPFTGTPLTVRRLPGKTAKRMGPGSDVYKSIWTLPSDDPSKSAEELVVAVKDIRSLYDESNENTQHAAVTLLREAHILSRIKHDNVLPIFGLCQFEDANSEFCLVMPWVPDFMTLRKFLVNNPDANRHALLTDVAAGLEFLHGNHAIDTATKAADDAAAAAEIANAAEAAATSAERIAMAHPASGAAVAAAAAARLAAVSALAVAAAGKQIAGIAALDAGVHIVHGDLHEGNILITSFGEGGYRAVICDFGLSKVVAGGTKASFSHPGSSRHGVFLAPELLQDTFDPSAVRSKATDVFAYAFLIHVAFNTPTPEHSVDPMMKLPRHALAARILAGERYLPPTHRHFTENMRKLMEKCWSQNPAQRPPMEAVVRWLPACAPGAAEK